MIAQSTYIQRSPQGKGAATSAPYVYGGQIKTLELDGKLDDLVSSALDKADPADTKSILRDASALKALFTDPAVAAAKAEAREHYFSEVSVDLGQGPQTFNITRMPSGDFRFINNDDPGYDSHAQAIVVQGGEHGHYATLSTRIPGFRDSEELLQKVTMSFTGSQKFVVHSEELLIGRRGSDDLLPHVPAWDHNPNFAAVRPFAR